MKYLILLLLLTACASLQPTDPQMGIKTEHVVLTFVDQEILYQQCEERLACIHPADSRGQQIAYFKERKGWEGTYEFDLTVHYISWDDIHDICGGYACEKNDLLYVHDYQYWNDQAMSHYRSWGAIIAQRLDLPEKDFNVHCVIGEEIGYHQFGEHKHINESGNSCF